MNLKQTICLVFICLGWTQLVQAVPNEIRFVGRAVTGNTNYTGLGHFKFSLVDGAGTTTYWSHDGTGSGGGEPTGSNTLNVVRGLYQVHLGGSGMVPIPAGAFQFANVKLRVWFSSGSGFAQQSPDFPFNPVGYAMAAAEVFGGPNDADADPLNETNSSIRLVTTTLQLTDAAGTLMVDLLPLVQDADSDPLNETTTALNLTSNQLAITDGGPPVSVDLSPIQDDADADPLNEATLTMSVSTNFLTIAEPGGALSTDLSSLLDDADTDPTNELNTGINFNANILEITDAAGTLSLDLSSLVNDADTDPSNEFNIAMNLNTNTLEIRDASGLLSLPLLSILNDADASPTNELNLSLTAISNTLFLVDLGGTQTVALPNVLDTDWTQSGGHISQTGAWVGIGDATPDANLDVEGGVIIASNLLVDTGTLAVDALNQRVGIGTTNPAVELDVVGNAVTTGDYTFETSKTFYLSVPASAFYADDQDGDYVIDGNDGFLATPQFSSGLIFDGMASLMLPDGAVIDEMRIYYRDWINIPDVLMELELFRRGIASTNTSAELMASIITQTLGASNEVQSSATTLINDNVVDNQNYQYNLNICWDPTGLGAINMQFYGVRIRYTLDRLKPNGR